MQSLANLFESGRIADVILAVLAIEFVVLLLMRANWHRLAVLDIIALLVPGLFLVLALRAALMGAGWMTTALCLTGALVAHLFDLSRRLADKKR